MLCCTDVELRPDLEFGDFRVFITRDRDKTLKGSPDFYFQNSCVLIMKTQAFIYEFMHKEVMIVKL